MAEIAAMTEKMVAKAKGYDRDTIPATTPRSRRLVPSAAASSKNYRRFTCTGKEAGAEGCGFSITKIPAGRSFELHEVEAFLRDKRIGPLEGFRSKAGWPFTAEMAPGL